jgi:hypothetical protein
MANNSSYSIRKNPTKDLMKDDGEFILRIKIVYISELTQARKEKNTNER